MTWPRLWRLWQEPAPNTQWSNGRGLVLWVQYLEGIPGARSVCLGVLARNPDRWVRERASLWAFRRNWVWMREVRP